MAFEWWSGWIYLYRYKKLSKTLEIISIPQNVRKRVKKFIEKEIQASDNHKRFNPHEFIIEKEQEELVKTDGEANGGDLHRGK